MSLPSTHLKTPPSLISKGLLHIGYLLTAMLFLVAMSLWLHHQQANRTQFLQQQQIPFIKNNAQLIKSVADLDRQLVAQQLAISHPKLQQPLEDLKAAWEHIVALSQRQVGVANDSLRDTQVQNIANQAQEFANGYKRFVMLVDDLLLMRQARNNQYNANMVSLAELIYRVNQLREQAINKLNQQPRMASSSVNTESVNAMLVQMNKAQFYQQIYQQLLNIENQLVTLSNAVTTHQFNQISTDIAGLTRNINKQLSNRNNADEQQLQADIVDMTNQLMGSGQLFAKWRDENVTTDKVMTQLKQYQSFLTQTVELIEKPNFYALPEFSLSLPVLNLQVKESSMMTIVSVFVISLLVFSLIIAWRIIELVKLAYQAGISDMSGELTLAAAAEKAKIEAKAKEKQQLKTILADEASENPEPAVKHNSISELDLDSQESQPSFYKVNNLVMNLDKFNKYHGSTEMAVYMLDDYIDRNNKNFSKLKEALAHENMAQVSQLNNAILKVANILCAPRLVKVCEQMQTVSQQRNMQQVVPLLVEMNAAIKEVAEFVAEA